MFVSIRAKVHVMYVYSLYYARLMMYSRIAIPQTAWVFCRHSSNPFV